MQIRPCDSVPAATLANYTVNPQAPVSGYTHNATVPHSAVSNSVYSREKGSLIWSLPCAAAVCFFMSLFPCHFCCLSIRLCFPFSWFFFLSQFLPVTLFACYINMHPWWSTCKCTQEALNCCRRKVWRQQMCLITAEAFAAARAELIKPQHAHINQMSAKQSHTDQNCAVRISPRQESMRSWMLLSKDVRETLKDTLQLWLSHIRAWHNPLESNCYV